MYMHPKTYLWLQEQDREREFQQRALQRAAQSGGEQRPGLVRGGIASIVKFVRRGDVGATSAGRPRPIRPLSSPAPRALDPGPAVVPPLGAEGRRPGPYRALSWKAWPGA